MFFIDRSLGRTAGVLLREGGACVELHDDHFAQDTPDERLLVEVGAAGWVFVTKDKRIRYRPLERDAVVAALLRVFVLASSKSLTGRQMGELLVKHRNKMERLARKQPPPFIAGIYEAEVRVYDWSSEDA